MKPTAHRTQDSPERVAQRVAEAICRVNNVAGCRYDRLDPDQTPETLSERVANLLGTYVLPGDPYGWGDGRALATVIMEPKGGKGDCVPPLDYWSNGLDHSMRASELLGDVFIEFYNAAVACVWPV